MAFCSGTDSYLYEYRKLYKLDTIEPNVVAVRSSQSGNSCYVTPNSIYQVDEEFGGKVNTVKFNLPQTNDCVVEVCPLFNGQKDPQPIEPSIAVLMGSRVLMIMTTQCRLMYFRPRVKMICSSYYSCMFLTEELKLYTISDTEPVEIDLSLSGPDGQDWKNDIRVSDVMPELLTNVVGMSCFYDDHFTDWYTILIWNRTHVVEYARNYNHTWTWCRRVRELHNIQYAQAYIHGMLVFTHSGEIINNKGVHPGYSRIAVRGHAKFEWLGVKSDGSHDLVCVDEIEPYEKNLHITMGNMEPFNINN